MLYSISKILPQQQARKSRSSPVWKIIRYFWTWRSIWRN